LIKRPGLIVSQDTILSEVWPATYVQPDNIKVLVRELRQAFEDQPREPRFIRNEPGRGYGFVAPLSDLPPADMVKNATASLFTTGDLARLKDALAAVDATGECRIVQVEGERGTGKTTLCDQFVEYARRLPSVRVCYGQCLPHAGPAEPYLPVLDALHHLAGQSPATIPSTLARYAPGWLGQLFPLPADGMPVAAGLPAPESTWLILELGALLETLASEGTTVIVLEDLHWGDLETIELLRGLARRHAPLRTLIVTTAVPYAGTVVGAALRNLGAELRLTGRCVSMPLASLDEASVRTYLRARFGDGRVQSLARLLHRLTGGNPLALVSVMDGLVASDQIAFVDGSWRLRHSPRTIEGSLPESVLEAILWRFDQLALEDLVTLELAASVGIAFTAETVAAAEERGSPMLAARRLAQLHLRGFVDRHDADPRRGEHPNGYRYGFLHPLHAELLLRRAPVFQQLRVAERLAAVERVTSSAG
jgi:predicted ATPase